MTGNEGEVDQEHLVTTFKVKDTHTHTHTTEHIAELAKHTCIPFNTHTHTHTHTHTQAAEREGLTQKITDSFSMMID